MIRGFLAGNIGLELGVVKAHLAQFQQTHFAGKRQYLQKERRQLRKKAFAKCGDGIVVGAGFGGDKPERHGIRGSSFNFLAGKNTGGLSVEQ